MHNGSLSIPLWHSPGIPIKTTLDNSSTVQYAGLIHQLVMKALSTVRDIDPQNDLTFLRVRSKKNEIMIAPVKNYFFIVIQNPSDWEGHLHHLFAVKVEKIRKGANTFSQCCISTLHIDPLLVL